jgi:hypothetical protein
LREIGSSAFVHCSSLKSIRIPAGVELLGRRCFGDCPMLTELLIERGSKLSQINDSVFLSLAPAASPMPRPDIVFEDQTFSRPPYAVLPGRWIYSFSGMEDGEFVEGYNHCFPA